MHHLLLTLVLAVGLISDSLVGGLAASPWNVVEAGAAADGTGDCTPVFQKLLDQAGASGGGVVTVPAGRYRIASHLVIPANVTLQGIYQVPPMTAARAATNLSGSVLFAYAGRGSTNEAPFINLAGNNAAIRGLIIAYPDWKQTDVPPVPYPPCVSSRDTENVGISECLLLNPYEGIRFVRAHRHWVRNLTGYPIWRGISVDECYDIGHIENVHFWPFGVTYDPKNPYCEWINTQGTAFELARTDWEYVLNTFCFGYGIGYRFSASKAGSANGNFLGLGADSCQRAVVVEQAQPPGLLITNGEFVGRWSSTNAVCLEVEPEVEGKVSLANCSFWGPIDRCVWMRSALGQFTASACNFVHWDTRGVGSAAVQLDAGKAIVEGCTFGQENLHVQVGSNVISAILTANQAAGGFRVENFAGKRAVIGLNEQDSIVWSQEARSHYRIDMGAPGDGRYLQAWHGPERQGRPCRWSRAESSFLLPVVPGQASTLTIEANVPEQALSADAGLYLAGQRLAPLNRSTPLEATLPASGAERVRVVLRCKSWLPQQTVADSKDARSLGIQVFSVTVRSAQAGETTFGANTGEWLR